MTDERAHFALTSMGVDAPAPVLAGVQARGRLDAVMFELTLRQTYRNTSDRVLEVVYTFPLPPMAVLLGFASELNGARQDGVIVAKKEAERQYEESLTEGDAPVMLEAHSDGLHTANIGNLKPGDEIVLEARFAQLLRFEQGRLRVSIPTTIAPRYGHAEQAGLQPQQVPLASFAAEYPLNLTLTIGEALAGATTECPTHQFTTRRAEDGTTRLDLAPGARLDRDVVVVVTPREPHPCLLVRADNTFDASAPVVMMTAFQPPMGAPRERIALKLLVDCSGSMTGDSIASARAALRGVSAGLTERDQVSLSRFGTTVEHLFTTSLAKPQALRHLQLLIDDIQADLGGTEMAAALKAVFGLPQQAGFPGADVLLITDGEIWQAEEMIAAARSSGHRVFAIGVGSAPAEGVLRTLAESTGGACEFATPGEALEAAAQRMLHRIRQPVLTNARIDWGSTPSWTSGPASSLFSGDTVLALAGFSDPIRASAVRLLADDAQGRTLELARGQADAPCPGDSLARIAASRRIAQDTGASALALALQYQLMSKQTNCILVHRRAETDKATESAELHRVRSMVAAGWGGLGSVRESALSYKTAFGNLYGASMQSADFSPRSISSKDPFDFYSARVKGGRQLEWASLGAMALAVEHHLADGGQINGLSAMREALRLNGDVRAALDDVAQLGLSPDQAWLLLAHWVNTRTNGLANATLAALLQPLVTAIDAVLAAAANEVFERILGGYPIANWVPTGQPQLRQASGGLGT